MSVRPIFVIIRGLFDFWMQVISEVNRPGDQFLSSRIDKYQYSIEIIRHKRINIFFRRALLPPSPCSDKLFMHKSS